MAESDNKSIIIKKVIKKGGHGHHGGAWKVAYADFVTAMMAFFLLLWLLNTTTDEQKMEIASYFQQTLGIFEPKNKVEVGSNGIMGGKTMDSEGKLDNSQSSPNMFTDLGPVVEEKNEEDSTNDSKAKKDVKLPPLTEEQAEKVHTAYEEKMFKEVEEKLLKAIEEIPDLKEMKENLLIDQTVEGLRIQIIDKDKFSMFPSGRSDMYDYFRRLLEEMTKVIAKMPNRISITGHTDSKKFTREDGYSNWDLSSERANASRKVMVAAGFDPKRISAVVGKAEQEPLLTEDTEAPQNRRISVILLRDELPK